MNRAVQTYDEAIAFLFGRINYERMADGAYSAGDLKLERVERLLSLLGNPQERVPAVHVAGTKGKGSTSVMMAEMLSAAGYTTGLFTSPHLSVFEERMRVDGRSPPPSELVEVVNRVMGAAAAMDNTAAGHGPTYFELATALAWLYFIDRGAQIAVLEVGLGGRLDATNICRPLVGLITNISRDHTNVLGDSVALIAREKAGIVKAGVPLISGVAAGPAGDVIEEVCHRGQSPLFRLNREIQWRPSDACPRDSPGRPRETAAAIADPMSIDVDSPWGTWRKMPVPLLGLHQGANAALAVSAMGLLTRESSFRISAEAMSAGLAAVKWPARVEVVGVEPTIVIDAAHNCGSIEALVQTLDGQLPSRRRILVFAASRDKDVAGMLKLLGPKFDAAIFTQYQINPRGVPVDELVALARGNFSCFCHAAADAESAWKLARELAAPDDLVCITGSFFIAAELRAMIVDGRPMPRLVAPVA